MDTKQDKTSTKQADAPVPIAVSYAAGGAWDENTHARMRWLRENDPVYWSEIDKLWVITRFADVSYVSRNQEIFTSGRGVRPGAMVKFGLIDEPEPRHTALRKLLNAGFTPRMVRKLEEAFTVLVKETLDEVGPLGACDFVDKIAVPLPLLMIAEMLGIKKENRRDFHRWSDAMIRAEGNYENAEIMQASALAFMEYSAHLTGIIEDRKVNPRDDLVSILTGADQGGVLGTFETSLPTSLGEEHEALAASELIMLLVVLMVAGNETTRNALSGGMQLLIENPEARKRLIDDPSLIPQAVEEMLRLTSPVRSFSRTVEVDTVLHGKQMRAGQLVLLCYPSANRDALEFKDPEKFDIDRNPQHLAFGIGSHFCLGASLARMELKVAFTELLRRMPDMRYSEDGPHLESNPLVRSCSRMMVEYTPEHA